MMLLNIVGKRKLFAVRENKFRAKNPRFCYYPIALGIAKSFKVKTLWPIFPACSAICELSLLMKI
ncbi:MAG: hypothetical protein ISS77_02455 [Phycisphaerae bacterium]|nr:hypothetical protein [Phycisphaerae bacterium]